MYILRSLIYRSFARVGVAALKAGIEQKKQISGLSYIDYEEDNPFNLFKDWWDIAHSTDIILPSKVCFSTASKNGQVSSRYLLVKEYDENGFVLISDARSRKFKMLKENPQAAMVFMWSYVHNNREILRQVRIEGEVKELNKDLAQSMYDDQPLFCKIRAHLCHQGQEVNWDDLNAKHDELVKRAEQGEDLPMPEHVVVFKLHPRMMEFYYSPTDMIADRLNFEKIEEMWVKKRIAA